MRTNDTYEHKAVVAAPATVAPCDVDDARAAFDRADAARNGAIERRDALIADLRPTYGRTVLGHPDVAAACAAIEIASREWQAAAIRHNTLAKARDRGAVDAQAAADRARADEQRELERARVRAATAGSRLRRLIRGVLP